MERRVSRVGRCGIRIASPRAPSYSYFNRREAARLRPVPLNQLRTDLTSYYRQLKLLILMLSNDDMKRSFPPMWWNSDHKPTFRYILRELAEHMQMHAADIQAWRKRNQIG